MSTCMPLPAGPTRSGSEPFSSGSCGAEFDVHFSVATAGSTAVTWRHERNV
jgi:hypothetical protein